MARNTRTPKLQTKKHLARIERERLQTRYILTAAGILLALIVLLIGYGLLDQYVLSPRRPVAVVNNERISIKQMQGQVRFGRYSLVQQARQIYQYLQFFGSDSTMMSQFGSQLAQISYELTPELINASTLDRVIDSVLIRQEAARRGITVSEAEIDEYFQEQLGYFPEGTPVPSATLPVLPTSTLSALQETLTAPTATPVITQTATATATVVVTPTATLAFTATPTGPVEPSATPAPTATATPYTAEGYQKALADTLSGLNTEFGIDEATLREVFADTLYRQKLLEAIKPELNVSSTTEQVWARHILVPDTAAAVTILERLRNGEDWCAQAATFSIDTSNAGQCGDLGWFGTGAMVAEFDTAAFALEVGEISEPVTSSFGVHIIQVLGHEDRPLGPSEYEQALSAKFDEFVAGLLEVATVERNEGWEEQMPSEPVLDDEILQAIQALMSGSTTP